jgi:hypothetical protein
MSSRVLLAVIALQGLSAFAQDMTPPPMVPVDEPEQQTTEEQPPPADQQQFQYAEPGTYSNAPADPNAQQPQQNPSQPQGTTTFAGSFMESTREKHLLALASGAIGVTRASPGIALDVRAEADIGKIALFAGYSGFGDSQYTSFIGHFMGMAGWDIFAREEITWRVLAGIDVINTPGVAAVGFVFGSNIRAMFAPNFGIDSAVFMTPVPFRQFEFRIALVLRWWNIFEAHLGWRYQAIEASQVGSLFTLFSTAPSINGPMVGLGLTF